MHSSWGEYSHLHANQRILNNSEVHATGGRSVMTSVASCPAKKSRPVRGHEHFCPLLRCHVSLTLQFDDSTISKIKTIIVVGRL